MLRNAPLNVSHMIYSESVGCTVDFNRFLVRHVRMVSTMTIRVINSMTINIINCTLNGLMFRFLGMCE